MYFQSRTEAGKLLAAELSKSFAGKPCSVVALSEGGVMVGLQVAKELECMVSLLLVEAIELPGEIDPIGAISENGSFSYNRMYAPGEIEELMFDYRGFVEAEKRTKLSDLHRLVGMGNNMRLELLRGKHIILINDGYSTGYSMDIALEVLKPVAMRSLSAASPIISPVAIDRMRVLTDRIFYLSVIENYLDTDHYYENNDVPAREDVVRIVQEMVEAWSEQENDEQAGEQDGGGEYDDNFEDGYEDEPLATDSSARP